MKEKLLKMFELKKKEVVQQTEEKQQPSASNTSTLNML